MPRGSKDYNQLATAEAASIYAAASGPSPDQAHARKVGQARWLRLLVGLLLTDVLSLEARTQRPGRGTPSAEMLVQALDVRGLRGSPGAPERSQSSSYTT